jgi:hypothetical protein
MAQKSELILDTITYDPTVTGHNASRGTRVRYGTTIYEKTGDSSTEWVIFSEGLRTQAYWLEDYADPTGSTDAVSAINSLATLAAANNKPIMVRGTYKMLTTPNIPSYVTVLGTDREQAIFVSYVASLNETGSHSSAFQLADDATGILFKNIQVKAATETINSVDVAFKGQRPNGIRIEDCKFKYLKHGVYAGYGETVGCKNFFARNNHIEDCSTTIQGNTDHAYSNAYMFTASAGGVQENIRIENDFVKNFGDNLFGGWYVYINGPGGNNIQINNNTILNSAAGISPRGDGGDPLKNVVISGNTFTSIRKQAIFALNIDGFTVTGNIGRGRNSTIGGGGVQYQGITQLNSFGNTWDAAGAGVQAQMVLDGTAEFVIEDQILNIGNGGWGIAGQNNTKNGVIGGFINTAAGNTTNIAVNLVGNTSPGVAGVIDGIQIKSRIHGKGVGVRFVNAYNCHIKGAIFSCPAWDDLQAFSILTSTLCTATELIGGAEGVKFEGAIGSGCVQCLIDRNVTYAQTLTNEGNYNQDGATGNIARDNRRFGADQDSITFANIATPTMGSNQGQFGIVRTGGTTTITDILNARRNQMAMVVADYATTIQHGTPIQLNGNSNYVMASGNSLLLFKDKDDNWKEWGRFPTSGGAIPNRTNFVATSWNSGVDTTRFYTSIQSAINDAVTRFSPTSNNRAQVIVYPGSYGSVLTAAANVDVIVLEGPIDQLPTDTGVSAITAGNAVIQSITFAPTGSTEEVSVWSGFKVTGDINVDFTGKTGSTRGKFAFKGACDNAYLLGRDSKDLVQLSGTIRTALSPAGLAAGFVVECANIHGDQPLGGGAGLNANSCIVRGFGAKFGQVDTAADYADCLVEIPNSDIGGIIGFGTTGTYAGGSITIKAKNSICNGLVFAGDGPATLDAPGLTVEAGHAFPGTISVTAASPVTYTIRAPRSKIYTASFDNDGGGVIDVDFTGSQITGDFTADGLFADGDIYTLNNCDFASDSDLTNNGNATIYARNTNAPNVFNNASGIIDLQNHSVETSIYNSTTGIIENLGHSELLTGTGQPDISTEIVLCDTSGGNLTVDLPNASGVQGKQYHIKKISSDSNSMTLDGFESQTIDGTVTVSTTGQFDSYTVVASDGNWYIV